MIVEIELVDCEIDDSEVPVEEVVDSEVVLLASDEVVSDVIELDDVGVVEAVADVLVVDDDSDEEVLVLTVDEKELELLVWLWEVVDEVLIIGGGRTKGEHGSLDIKSSATYRLSRLRPPQISVGSPVHLVLQSVSGADAVPLPSTTPQ